MTHALKDAVCDREPSPAPVFRAAGWRTGARRSLFPAVVAAMLYLALAVYLSGVRPLWLDEILQLNDTRQSSPAGLIVVLPTHHLGSAPLGYLTQQAALRISGFSLRRARLTAAIFGAAAILAVFLLAASLGLHRPWIATLLFGALPLALRYSAEARPYSQALFFSVAATILYWKLSAGWRWRMAGAYGLVLAAAAYTQPYSASVGLAHVLWSMWCGDRRTAARATLVVALAYASFLPWLCWSHDSWVSGLAGSGWSSSLSARTPHVLFRELTGAGYWGSGLLVMLCVLAVVRRSSQARVQVLLILLALVPTAAAVAGNACFGYFLAARQFLWVLPPLALLAGSLEWRGRMVPLLVSALVAVCIWQSVRFYGSPREDWEAAAHALRQSARSGSCVLFAPSYQAVFYELFEPGLTLNRGNCPRAVIAVTPYATREEENATVSALRAQGYRKAGEAFVGGSRLLQFSLDATR